MTNKRCKLKIIIKKTKKKTNKQNKKVQIKKVLGLKILIRNGLYHKLQIINLSKVIDVCHVLLYSFPFRHKKKKGYGQLFFTDNHKLY